MSPAVIHQAVTASFLYQRFWKVMPHLDRAQPLVEKNESGAGVQPIAVRVCKPPHSELMARSMNEEILGRYTVSTFHGTEKIPSANVFQQSVERDQRSSPSLF
jgi:hypothetical protein